MRAEPSHRPLPGSRSSRDDDRRWGERPLSSRSSSSSRTTWMVACTALRTLASRSSWKSSYLEIMEPIASGRRDRAGRFTGGLLGCRNPEAPSATTHDPRPTTPPPENRSEMRGGRWSAPPCCQAVGVGCKADVGGGGNRHGPRAKWVPNSSLEPTSHRSSGGHDGWQAWQGACAERGRRHS